MAAIGRQASIDSYHNNVSLRSKNHVMMNALGNNSNGKINSAFESQSIRMGQLPVQSDMSANVRIENNDKTNQGNVATSMSHANALNKVTDTAKISSI